MLLFKCFLSNGIILCHQEPYSIAREKSHKEISRLNLLWGALQNNIKVATSILGSDMASQEV
jgi:hypothetical protein